MNIDIQGAAERVPFSRYTFNEMENLASYGIVCMIMEQKKVIMGEGVDVML